MLLEKTIDFVVPVAIGAGSAILFSYFFSKTVTSFMDKEVARVKELASKLKAPEAKSETKSPEA